jgi:hypothetical protein
VDYLVDRKTAVRWFSALGFDASELFVYDYRYSFQTGINGCHQFDRRVGVNGGLFYVHSLFGGNELLDDVTENSVFASAGLSYLLWSNVSLHVNYSYMVLESDTPEREFDRHRITLGMSASF